MLSHIIECFRTVFTKKVYFISHRSRPSHVFDVLVLYALLGDNQAAGRPSNWGDVGRPTYAGNNQNSA